LHSRVPWPRSTTLPGHLAYGAFLPPRTHFSRVPPGLPASLSRCPPLAVQRPQHSDRASYTSARRPLSLHGHATRSPRRTRPNPKPIVDVPGLHQAAMQPQGTSVATQPDATRGSGANRNHGEHVGALSTAPRDAASTSRSSPTQAPQARAPNATSQHRWGGVYPKPTLLLSVRGCEWGSRPLSSDFHPTSQTRAMRVQVLNDTVSP